MATDLVSVLVRLPLRRERVPLLVVEVFLQVEEGVEEDGGHAAPPEVGEGQPGPLARHDHVQHLGNRNGRECFFWLPSKTNVKFSLCNSYLYACEKPS